MIHMEFCNIFIIKVMNPLLSKWSDWIQISFHFFAITMFTFQVKVMYITIANNILLSPMIALFVILLF